MAEAKPAKLTRAEADALRKKAADLRHSIVESALSDSEVANVAAVQQFRSAHDEQRRVIETGCQRAEKLNKAIVELEPLESDLKQKQQSLSKVLASLSEFHRPLGQAAFQARLEGAVTDQPAFAERLAVHERIEDLRKEYENLTPAPNAGTVEKAKAKAQQLAVAGKIKLEETKIGKLESKIGQQLIEESQEGSVRCEQTEQVISQIAERRAEIAQLTEQEYQSRETLATEAEQLSQFLSLSQIEGSRALADELNRCSAAVTQAEKDQRQLEDELLAKLSADESIPADSKMGARVAELRHVEDQLQHAPTSPIAGMVSWFSELSMASKALVIGGAGMACLLFLCSGGIGLLGPGNTEPLVGDGSRAATNLPETLDSSTRHSELTLDGLDPTPLTKGAAPDRLLEAFARVQQLSGRNSTSLPSSPDFSTTVYKTGPDGEPVVEQQGRKEGQSYVEQGFKDKGGNFVRHGVYRLYFRPGEVGGKKEQPAVISYRFNGKKHGVMVKFWQNGNVAETVPFENDNARGLITFWHENGQLEKAYHEAPVDDPDPNITSVRTGPYLECDENGMVTKCGVNDEGGYKDGIWMSWHSTSHPNETTPYTRGKIHGLVRQWYESGKPKSTIEYENGMAHGNLRVWHETGELKKEAQYNQGEFHGQSISWHPNGNKHLQENWKDGVRHGTFRGWTEDGSKRHSLEFDHGRLTRWSTKTDFLVALDMLKHLGPGTNPEKQYISVTIGCDTFLKTFGPPAKKEIAKQGHMSDEYTDYVWTYRFSDGDLRMIATVPSDWPRKVLASGGREAPLHLRRWEGLLGEI